MSLNNNKKVNHKPLHVSNLKNVDHQYGITAALKK